MPEADVEQELLDVMATWRQRFKHMATGIVGPNNAEDVVQDAYLKAWSKCHQFEFRNGSKLSTWVMRIVIWTALATRRKYAAAKRRGEELEVMAGSASYRPDFDAPLLLDEVLASLGKKHRARLRAHMAGEFYPAVGPAPMAQRVAVAHSFYLARERFPELMSVKKAKTKTATA